MRRELVLAWHVHQPFFVPDEELREQIERSYRPLLALHRELDVPFCLNVTGALLERMALLSPDVIELLREEIAIGRVEPLASGKCHPLLPLLPNGRARAQVQADAAIKERVLGVRPRGFWPADLGWCHSLVDVVAEAGVRWITADSSAKVAAAALPAWSPAVTSGHRVLAPDLAPLVSSAELGEVHRLELCDRSVCALLRHHELSWDLVDLQDGVLHRPDRLEPFVESVFAHYDAGADLLMLGDDGERVHPQTLASYRRVLEALRERDVAFVTGAEALASREARATPIYLPASTFLVDFAAWRTTPDDLVCWRQLEEVERLFEEVARAAPDAPELAALNDTLLECEDSAFTFWKYLRRTREPFHARLAELRARLRALRSRSTS